jgi:hypothetical protein
MATKRVMAEATKVAKVLAPKKRKRWWRSKERMFGMARIKCNDPIEQQRIHETEAGAAFHALEQLKAEGSLRESDLMRIQKGIRECFVPFGVPKKRKAA